MVMTALQTQRDSLMNQGEGSEDLSGRVFDDFDGAVRPLVKDHAGGAGSVAKQALTEEQRLTGQLKVANAEKRINDIETLAKCEKNDSGNLVFAWGGISMPQKEQKDKDGKVTVPYRASTVFLKTCPRCGRGNHYETGQSGICYHCSLDISSIVPKMIEKYPEVFKGVEI